MHRPGAGPRDSLCNVPAGGFGLHRQIIRRQQAKPAPFRPVADRPHIACGSARVLVGIVIGVHPHRQTDLLELAEAGGQFRPFPRLTQRGKQHRS